MKIHNAIAILALLSGSCFATEITRIDITFPRWMTNSNIGPDPASIHYTPANATFWAIPIDYQHYSDGPRSVEIGAFVDRHNILLAVPYVALDFSGVSVDPNQPGPLTPGNYTNIARWPFNTTGQGQAGFDANVDYRGENIYDGGSFQILEAIWNADGTLAHFGATFYAFSDYRDYSVFPDAGGNYPMRHDIISGDVYYNYDGPLTTTPEPGTLGLLSAALLSCFGLKKRRT